MGAAERFDAEMAARLEGLRDEGLYKSERVIASRQSGEVRLADGRAVVNLCANNYLGLADDAAVIAAAQAAGAVDVQVSAGRDLREAEAEGRRVFLEAEIVVEAGGRPRVAEG